MSALSSKHSIKANFSISSNNNDPKSTQRNKQKHQKTASKYSSSAFSNKQQPMQIAFQKTGEKIKKNLSKQFQTFNINYEDKQITFHKEGAKNQTKNINNQKLHKSKTKTQATTQAKSPLVKSTLSSKTKLSQYQQKQELPQSKSKAKLTLKKQREKSNSQSQQQQNRSQKSSPQVSPSCSKLSDVSSKKRAFSKAKLQNSSNILQKYQKQSSKLQSGSFLKYKINSSRQMKSSRNDYQINFPQLITQSQSLQPSSYPNTGKDSQNLEKFNYNREEEEDNNQNILQEDESEYINSQQRQEGNISREQIAEPKSKAQKSFGFGYHQLPQSYITAMQILQQKIEQHQHTINKLHKQINLQNTRYSQLQNHFQQLQQQLNNKQAIISQKDAQIKFLKGYLNEEKNNNRQALKEVAKNVYERTLLSAKKDNIKGIKNDRNEQIVGKQKRKLFQNSASKHDQQIIQATSNFTKAKPDLIQRLIAPQIKHQKQVSDGLQRQAQLEQDYHKQQQLLKDQIMRSQLLMQEVMKKQIQQKKNQYLQQEKQQQYMKQAQSSRRRIRNEEVFGNQRDRSMSTAVKVSEQRQVGQTTYRPRNVSFNGETQYKDYTNIKPSYGRAALKQQQLKDPILQKYIQAKSQLSSHPYARNNTASSSKPKILNYQIIEGQQLKSEKKNKQTVSKMRELMRAEKELIALNYKLEAFEKKILNAVQSSSDKDQYNNQKPSQQRQAENLLLEDLQRQYAVVKKEFEKKELAVKQLKNNLEADG